MKFRLPSRISTIGATAGAASSSVASAGRSAAVKQEDGRSLEAFDQRGHIKAADVIAILDAGGPQAPSSAVSAFWLACWAEIRRQVELCGTDGGPTSPFRTTEVDAAISLMGMFMSGGGERSPEPSQSFLVKLRDGDEELRVAVLRGSEAVPPESEGVWVPIEFARGIVGPKWDQHPALAVKVHPPRSNSGASASEDSNNGDEDSSQTVAEPPVVIDPAQLTLINPLQPLTTPLWLTSIDGIYVYITWLHRTLPPTPGQGIALLRRVDNDMINATLLLHAGGLETDQERTIVLSLERQRVRCRKGMLFGTWVPLARARDLARGVCLDQRLGGFLEESLGLGVFGLDHPSDKKKRKKKRKVAAQQASLDTSWIEMVEDEEADKEEAERASKRVKTESASPGPSPGVTVEAQVPVNPAVVPPVTTLPQIPPYPIPIAIPTPIPLVVPVAT
ncbi:hypothetical protein HK101_011288 [Irineochytrium annulatum]|nr:hypothetical protein HK101_011288 [Irineochytrium annulatum]